MCSMEDSELRDLFTKMTIKLDSVSRTVSNIETNSKRMDNRLAKIEIDTKLLPDMWEMIQTSGNNIEVIAQRVEWLKKYGKNIYKGTITLNDIIQELETQIRIRNE